jgi:hypothetical protein
LFYFDKYSVGRQPAGRWEGERRRRKKKEGKTEHEKPKVSVSAITMLGLYVFIVHTWYGKGEGNDVIKGNLCDQRLE